ncbi:MAG TPA: hypothetical protein VNT75_10015 [Symbiobacteriaceae bacterium]|nr:hypothetical protein [Symbiobacteriaceae bacterium]
MAAHLNDLGFLVETDDQLVDLARTASDSGAEVPTAGGACYCWAPGEGVEVWVELGPRGELRACNPHFSGGSKIRVKISDMIAGDGNALHGRIQAWAGSARGSLFAGPPLILDLPDMELVRQQVKLPVTAWVQIAAFAHAAECFPDEQAFRLWQEGRPTPMSPECFIPSGAFAQPPRPEAAFAGRIEQADLRTNPVTGRPFHHLRVKTSIGTVDLVADPESLDGIPMAGGIVQGYFALSGRIVGFG